MRSIADLSDKRIWRGKDMQELQRVLEYLDQITTIETLSSVDVELLSLKKGVVSAPGTLSFRRYHPLEDELPSVALPLENAENKARLAPLVRELKQNGLMLMNEKDKFFTADTLISTMALRIGTGGSNIKRPSFKRDAYFAELLGVEEQDVKLLVRSVDGIKKAFAMHSGRYTLVKQTLILDIIGNIAHGLGKPVCKNWEVTNSRTEVYLEFPQKAMDFTKTYGLPKKVVPGLRLITSDVGESSVCAIGTWRLDGTPFGVEVYTRKHVGRIDPEKILKQIGQKIFVKYDRLPQRLCELMRIEISNPNDCIESVLRQINLQEKIGIRRVKQLQEIVQDQFARTARYTAYDIAVAILALPDTVHGISKHILKKFTDCIAQAAFVDYEEWRTPLVAIPA